MNGRPAELRIREGKVELMVNAHEYGRVGLISNSLFDSNHTCIYHSIHRLHIR
jgi:hypothetical protein